MNVGIPKEIRPAEYRVGLSPAGVQMLTKRGHTCYVENEAGFGVGFSNQDYEKAGAKIVYSAHEALGRADLILKFSRPLENEIELLQSEAIVAGFLHLPSASQKKIDLLLKNGITTLAYEQFERPDGTRPILHPLSAIGGTLAAQTAAYLLQNNAGGKGILLGGAPGVPPAEVVIIGAGSFGSHAVKAFLAAGAQVTVLDNNPDALKHIHEDYPHTVTMFATTANIQRTCAYADVVLASAASFGQRAPILITREILKSMKPRAIVMDISIDQGGCVETSHPTTHENPTFIEEGVIHYCVPNMSSILARTATHAFINAAMPYILEIVEKGIDIAKEDNSTIANGICTYKGKLINLTPLSGMEG